MNSSKIDRILSRNPIAARYYRGVYPFEKIPAIGRYPEAFLVLNADKYYEKGRHWLAVFIQDRHTIDFFDSYGYSLDAFGIDARPCFKVLPQMFVATIAFISL